MIPWCKIVFYRSNKMCYINLNIYKYIQHADCADINGD